MHDVLWFSKAVVETGPNLGMLRRPQINYCIFLIYHGKWYFYLLQL